MVCTLLAYMPATSASVSSGWTAEPFRNLLWHLWLLSPNSELVVLSRKGYELDVVRELAADPPLAFRFESLDHALLLPTLAGASVIGQRAADPLVLLPLAAALLPKGAVDQLVAAHFERRADVTFLEDMPRSASPVVYMRSIGSAVLQRLGTAAAQEAMSVQQWTRLILERSGANVVNAMRLPGLGPSRVLNAPELRSIQGMRAFDHVCRNAGIWYGEAATTQEVIAAAKPHPLLAHWQERRDVEDAAEVWATPRQSAWFPSKKLRVLYVSQLVAYSGAEESLHAAVSGLPSDRFDRFALLGYGGHFESRLKTAGVHTYVAGRSFSINTPRSFRYVSRVLEESRPDVVHFNSFSGFPALVVAKLWGCKCVYHLRTVGINEEMVSLMRECDGVIAVSEFTKEAAIRAGVPEGRVKVIYDPLSHDSFHAVTPSEKREAKRELGLDPDVPSILMVARYERRKRHDLLIEALARIGDAIPYQCVLVGESDGDFACESEVRHRVTQSGLDNRVFTFGFRTNISVFERAADVAVLCSDNEPLGTFILESMAVGVPVIVSERGGLSEVVGDLEDCGLLCANGDVDGLAARLDFLLRNAQTRDRLGARARQQCLRVCGPSSIAALESFYDALIGDVSANR